MKKKIVIYIPKIAIGGMEQSLVNILKLSDICEKYDVTLYIGYKTSNELYNQIPADVKIKIFTKGRWNIFTKIVVGLKMYILLMTRSILKIKYDVSVCFSHHHGLLAKVTLKSSDNSILFIHADLGATRTQKQVQKLFKKLRIEKFKKIMCVSDLVKNKMCELLKNEARKIFVLENYIDGKKIISLSEKKVDLVQKEKTFINIARHDESCKKITRIIESSKKLKEKNYNFKVLLFGDGRDKHIYEDMIAQMNLSEEVKLMGMISNPYCYLKKANALISASLAEGYGITLLESIVLDVPIIATDTGIAKELADQGYGILCDNSEDGVYQGMEKFLNEDFIIKEKFNYVEHNKRITDKLNKLLEL